MIESGQLVARLGVADDAWLSALGTVRRWRRPDLVKKAFAEHFAHPARIPSWTITAVHGSSEHGDAENETVEAVFSIAFDARGRRRRAQVLTRRGEEWLPDLVVIDGPTYWTRTAQVIQTNGGDERRSVGGTDIVNLLMSSRVPDGYHLDLINEVEQVAGRTCVVAIASPREPDPFGHAPGSEIFDMIAGGTMFRLSVDQQRGVLLRVAKLVDNVEAEVCEFLDVIFDAPLEADLFAPLT